MTGVKPAVAVHAQNPKPAAGFDWRAVGRRVGAATGLYHALPPVAEDADPDALLEVRNIEVRFGGIMALDGVSFTMRPGVIQGLIGPNGAGKTTLFNCMSRLYTPTSGDVLFQGRSILSAAPHDMARLGMGRTFQNLALFPTMTTLENVMVGGHVRHDSDFGADALGPIGFWRSRTREQEMMAEAWELVQFLGLEEHVHTPVAGLPFGLRKRVELARALASRPKLLLLDEPAGGLNHDDVDALGDLIKRLRDERNLTVLLVEHHMSLVMAVSDRVVAIDFGRKIGEGEPAEIQTNPEVIHAYLGEPKKKKA